ncbi:MAG: hypothetical protein QM785_16080 [Pyrinomonadaceae bacterium]
MTRLFTVFVFAFILAAVSFGQTKVSNGAQLELNTKPRIAVLEFTPDSTTRRTDGTQALQNGIVEEMTKKEGHKDWIEIPSTSVQVRAVYQQLLGRSVDPATAVKIGKLLGVNYVMTGTYSYDHKLGGGSFLVRSEIINVATGATKWNGTAKYSGTTYVNNGTLQFDAKVSKPVIQQLTASLKAADL